MIFLVVDTDSYDLLLGLDFLMKIGVVIDVEKGVIQVQNGPNVAMEVSLLNVVNMLQLVTKLKETYLEEFNNLRLKYLYVDEAKTQNFQLFYFNDCYDDYIFEDEMSESEDDIGDNPKGILLVEMNKIEELNDHGMNQVLDEEVSM